MKSFKFTKILLSIITTTGFVKANQVCDKVKHSGYSVTANNYKVGKIGSSDYELWFNGGSNSATFYSDGSMKCSFQNTMNYICRSGLSFDSTKTYDQIGHLYADYNSIVKDSKNIEFSYIGVYGWTKNPLTEFLIIDNWIDDKRPSSTLGKNYGDFIINGEEYTIYKNERTSDTIVGYSKYRSYSSVRKTKRTCGTVDITAHFEQWSNIGLSLGSLHEVKVFAQVGSNSASGTIDFPYASVYIKEDSNNVNTKVTDKTTKTSKSSNNIPTSSVVVVEPTEQPTSNVIDEVPTRTDIEHSSNIEEATTTQEVTTTSESVMETSDPNLTTPYDIKNEKDMEYILEAETVEPLETYIIPESIPASSTIISKEFYLLPVLNEEYKDSEIFKEDDEVIEPMAIEEEEKPKSQPTTTKEEVKSKSTTEANIDKENCVPLYGQCGGQNYNGITCCKEGKCTMINPWYYQCIY